MYSKLALGLVMAGAASAAEIVRRDTAGGGHSHDHSHAHAAAPAPSSGYAEPAQSYAAPSTGYAASSGSGYGGYETQGYEEEGGFDLSTIIIPILIIFGLSLLFPTVTSVSVGRKRRDIEEDVSPMTDIVERVNSVYMAVVESEECMERIACEIGGLAADVGLKENAVAKMADPFVPAKYKAYYKQFTSGQNCHKIKCGKLF